MSATDRSSSELSPAEKRALLAKLLQERRAGRHPLSFAQQRLWFLDRFAPGDPTYNIPFALRLPGWLDASAVAASVNEIVRRHEMLRTTFEVVDGTAVQVVAPSLSLRVREVDLSSVPAQEREAEASRVAAEEGRRPFDLGRGPLIRVTLVKLSEADHLLVVVMHHIVSDGWSMTVFLDELSKLYSAFSVGAPSPLPELALQYADFARWQAGWLKGESLERELEYWRAQLGGAPATLELPTDRPRPAVQSRRGAVHTFSLDARVVEALRALGRSENATLFMTTLAALDTLLHRYVGETDVAIGTPIANRTRPELEGLIGFFVNTLVLRTDLSGDPSFRELLRRVRDVALDAYAHQDVPFEKLVEELHVERDLGRNPLFQVMFSLQSDPAGAAAGAGAAPAGAQAPLLTTGTAKFDLTLTLAEGGGRPAGVVEYNTDLFDERTVVGLCDCFGTLLRGIAADPDLPLSRLPLIAGEEEERVGEPAARADRVAPSIAEAVAARAAADPKAAALVCGDATLTYFELDRRSNQVASELASRGVPAGARVGVAAEDAADLVVATLGALKAGAQTVLLDPGDPPARRAAIVADAAPELILVGDEPSGPLPSGTQTLRVGDTARVPDAPPSPRPAIPDQPGFLVYRSARSGRPECVRVSERVLAGALHGTDLGVGTGDRVAGSIRLDDDHAYLTLFGTLAAGATYVVLDPSAPPRKLAVTLRDARATVIRMAGSTVERLAREFPWGLKSARLILTRESPAGLPADVAHVVRIPHGTLDAGGLWALEPLAAQPQDGRLPQVASRPDGPQLLVLDRHLQPLPEGAIGDLHVAAPDGPHRTEERGRRLANGRIELRGRCDNQTTLRGTRIHPEEIERALREHDGLDDAAVVVRRDPEPQLVAYVVPAAGAEQPAAAELGELAGKRLPSAAVPSLVRTLERLPRRATGVLDRRALAAIDAAELRADAATEHVSPRTDTERRIADIWTQTLGAERPGIHENFFALGGHSLAATRVVARIGDAFGIELPLRPFFESPTIAAIAEVVDGLEGAPGAARLPKLVPARRDGPAPLSFAQQRLWFLDRFQPGDPTYNIPFALRLPGTLDAVALERSLEEIVRRHEMLRTSFEVVDGSPVQVVSEAQQLAVEHVDLAAVPAGRREAEASRWAAAESARPFDLARGPLVRVSLVRLTDTDHLLVVVMHHIVSDGWSMTVFLDELAKLHAAFGAGERSPLPELEIQYGDFARWQAEWLRDEALELELGYWRKQLSGVRPLLDLPLDRPRPALQTRRGALYAFSFDASAVRGLHAITRSEGTTPFITWLTAFDTLLHRYLGETDIVVGTPIANRRQPELERLIGFFVNTLVLRSDLSGDPSFRELLRRVRDVALDAYAHQDVPFEKLVEDLEVERDLGRNPLFQVMFSVHAGEASGDSTREPPLLSTGTAKFDLTMTVADSGDRASATVEYNTDLFDEATIAELCRRFGILLGGIATKPGLPLSEFALLEPDERRTLDGPPDPEAGARPPRSIAAAVAEQDPQAPAVVYAGETLTYGRLRERAEQLAGRLASRGLARGARVGIAIEPSPDMIVAALAALDAGLVFVLLDPADPPARRAAIAADARCELWLASERSSEWAPESGRPLLLVDRAADEHDHDHDRQGAPAAAGPHDPDRVCCIAYRSGPSGRPEGVPVNERTLASALHAPDLEAHSGDAVALVPRIGDDHSYLLLFGTLAAGATIVMLDDAAPPRRLAGTLRDTQASLLYAPAATIARLAREFPWGLKPTRAILCADASAGLGRLGDALDGELAARVRTPHGTLDSGGWWALQPLGDRLLEHRDGGRALLLRDRHMEPVPDGVIAELYVVSAGGPRPTGELARRHRSGAIELRGRRDARVTVRGVRIHLEEVELALREHAHVEAAAVAVRTDPEPRLIAHVVTAGEPPSPAALAEHAAAHLPVPLNPAEYVFADGLPTTTAGELDRRALADIDAAHERAASSAEHVAPATATEAAVADIWAATLGIEEPGVHDNFFSLGGHSLAATRVVSRINDAFGIELPLRPFFESPTIAEIAAQVDALGAGEARPGAPRLEARERDRPPPLSFAQQRLWFLAQLEPDSSFYNIAAPVRMAGGVDVEALRRSLDALVARHESLRTTFQVIDDEPVQVIAPSLPLDLPVVDLTDLPGPAREEEARRLTTLDAQEPFDLVHGPLIRARLIELEAAEHILLLTVHHIVSDGWSMDVLFRDLSALYEAHRDGTAPALPELAVQYADFSLWQRDVLTGPELARQLDYWLHKLDGAPPVLELPTDRPRPAVQAFRGGTHTFTLPSALVERVKALGELEGATPFMTLLAAFEVLLHRYTGQHDLVVGTPIANRTRPELEGLVGFFANTLVLRAEVAGEHTFRQLLAHVRDVTLDAYAHQDVPFEKLVEELEPQRSLAHNPLFQVMFTLQNTGRVRPPGITGTDTDAGAGVIGTGVAKFDLTAFLVETTEGLDLGFEYNSDLFDASTVARMAGHFGNLLAGAVAEPDRPIASLPMLTQSELLQLLEWNATEAPAVEQSVHGLFEAQAERTPEASSVTAGGETATYAELNERANRVAHRLLRLGVTPDTPVGLCVERSLDMIAGVLGVLKAGGAYVPLDPSYPRQRLALMMEDARLGALITQARLAAKLPLGDESVVVIDDGAEAEPGDERNPGVPAHPEQLAYVLYTSGSTGRPKGVGMPHRPLVSLVQWQTRRSALAPGAPTLQFASLSFDVSFQEIFSTLCSGGTLVLVSDHCRRDTEALLRVIASERVQRLFMPYVALQQLAEQARDTAELPDSLREVITAGEQLHVTPQIRELFTRIRCPLYNQYGPSETHVVTEHELSGSPDSWPALPPIGRPIPGASVQLLDSAGQRVPVGVAADMYLGGLAQARGYLGRPGLTAERFVPDLEGAAGARLYASGDRARYLPDGTIEFLGRSDDQVKVRGFRVEPGEVESALGGHPDVRQAAVVARPDGSGGRRLIAYVQPAANKHPSTKELRTHLAASLPEHMVPAAYVLLDDLPLTPSGKLDRRRLPDPSGVATTESAEFVAPRTPTEQVLARIWTDLLAVDRVGIHDNFFDLGGHSLLATRVISRVRDELQCDIPLRSLFEFPTVELLALCVLQVAVDAEEQETERLLRELDEMSEEDARTRLAR
jgi:amino acid adenylation domain-containing protein